MVEPATENDRQPSVPICPTSFSFLQGNGRSRSREFGNGKLSGNRENGSSGIDTVVISDILEPGGLQSPGGLLQSSGVGSRAFGLHLFSHPCELIAH